MLALLAGFVAIWRSSAGAQVPISGLPTVSPYPVNSDLLPIAHFTGAVGSTQKMTINQFSTTFNVIFYGADPSAVHDSRPAIQAAINDAANSGGQVFLPAGTYDIKGPLYLPGGSYAIRGAGADSSTIRLNSSFADWDVFYSCPAEPPSPNPVLPNPSPSPVTTPSNLISCPAPATGNALSNVLFQDLTIDHLARAVEPFSPNDFTLPSFQNVTITRIHMHQSYNVVSAGETAANAWQNLTMANNNFDSFENAALALHGQGGGLSVIDNYITGNRSNGQFNSTVVDASDEFSTSNQYFARDDIEGFANGFVYLVPPNTVLSDATFDQLLFDRATNVDFYIRALPNAGTGTPPPLTQRVKITNSTLISSWDALYLDGGAYPNPAEGVTDVIVEGSPIEGGSPPGTAEQLTLFAGAPTMGDSITFYYYAPGSMTPIPQSYTIASGDTMDRAVAGLAVAIAGNSMLCCGTSKPLKEVGRVPLTNSYYGLLAVVAETTPSPGSLSNGSIAITSSGTESVVTPTPGPIATYGANLAAGDGVYITYNAQALDFKHDQFYSTQGAALHFNASAHVNVLNNTISQVYASNANQYGVYFDSLSALSDILIQGNDLTGNAFPFGGATPNPTASNMILRDNRGYDPIGFVAPQPAVPPSGTAVSSIYDCTIYMDVKTPITPFNINLVGTNGASYGVVVQHPLTILKLPANAQLTLTYATPPLNSWSWFCN